MIKNNNQYKRTLAKIAELAAAKKDFIEANPDKTTYKYELGVDSFDALIGDLEKEAEEYKSLCNGGMLIIQPSSLEAIPKAIIQIRIAKGLTQKEFAEKVGLKEQQIQRYEAEEYQGVSFARLLDFAEALEIDFTIQKIFLAAKLTDIFSYGDALSPASVDAEAEKVKERRSLLIA